MKTLGLPTKKWGFMFVSSAVAALAAASLVACFQDHWAEETGEGSARVETVDPLEGAYVKQGGTEVNFVFKRGDGEPDSFLGEIAGEDGERDRAKGTVVVGRDDLGTKLTLKMTGSASRAPAAGEAADTEIDASAPTDERPLAEQAFNGTMHFLRIGKNQTLLVRAEANGKTAQYKKVRSWCRKDSDCSPGVQNTGLACGAPSCSTKNTCTCD